MLIIAAHRFVDSQTVILVLEIPMHMRTWPVLISATWCAKVARGANEQVASLRPTHTFCLYSGVDTDEPQQALEQELWNEFKASRDRCSMLREDHRRPGFGIFISVTMNPARPQLRYVVSNAREAGRWRVWIGRLRDLSLSMSWCVGWGYVWCTKELRNNLLGVSDQYDIVLTISRVQVWYLVTSP